METEKTMHYPNFYENSKEMQMRLQHTVVLYDGNPCFVLNVADHDDGIIRLYLDPIGHPQGGIINRIGGIPYEGPPPLIGPILDEWMERTPGHGLLRKKANSPKFNRFRPFPLGMANHGNKVMYLERRPRREVYQGLTAGAIAQTRILLSPGDKPPTLTPSTETLHSVMLKDCILGRFPTIDETAAALCNPDIANEGVAFHREFALLRGPASTLFLAYRTEVVGSVKDKTVTLTEEFVHTKEAVEELQYFQDIRIG